MKKILQKIKEENDEFYKNDKCAFTFQQNDRIPKEREVSIIKVRSQEHTQEQKIQSFQLESDLQLLDPLGILHGSDELEPLEYKIIGLPIITPVKKIIVKNREKEDGCFARLTCERGEDSRKFSREMSKFFQK